MRPAQPTSNQTVSEKHVTITSIRRERGLEYTFALMVSHSRMQLPPVGKSRFTVNCGKTANSWGYPGRIESSLCLSSGIWRKGLRFLEYLSTIVYARSGGHADLDLQSQK